MPPFLTTMTCYIFLITVVLKDGSMSFMSLPSNDIALFGEVPMMVCPVPLTCLSTLLIERSDMDLRTRGACAFIQDLGKHKGVCGPSGLCTPHTWAMWDPSSSSSLKQTVSENHCLLITHLWILLKKQIQYLKFMTKHREVTGDLTCVSRYKGFIWALPLMSGPSTSFPQHISAVFLFLVFFTISPIFSLSLAKPHSVSLHNSFFPRVPLVTQGTLQVNCSPNSNLSAKTAEIVMQGSKTHFPSYHTIIMSLV